MKTMVTCKRCGKDFEIQEIYEILTRLCFDCWYELTHKKGGAGEAPAEVERDG